MLLTKGVITFTNLTVYLSPMPHDCLQYHISIAFSWYHWRGNCHEPKPTVVTGKREKGEVKKK
jgi:hypothetical protein